MRKLLVIGFLLALAATLAGAQEAQRTPPGGDMLGSDRSLQRGDIRTMPSPSPDQNQVMTNSAGSTTGYENNPAYAGASIEESQTEQGTGGNTGIQGQAAAISGRLGDYTGSSTGAPPARGAQSSSAKTTTARPAPAHRKGQRSAKPAAKTAARNVNRPPR